MSSRVQTVLVAGVAVSLAATSLALHVAGDAETTVFVLSCLAIIPFAFFMGRATEAIAERSGPAIGGLLNATFGNAAELIIAFAAMRAGMDSGGQGDRQPDPPLGLRDGDRRNLLQWDGGVLSW